MSNSDAHEQTERVASNCFTEPPARLHNPRPVGLSPPNATLNFKDCGVNAPSGVGDATDSHQGRKTLLRLNQLCVDSNLG